MIISEYNIPIQSLKSFFYELGSFITIAHLVCLSRLLMKIYEYIQ